MARQRIHPPANIHELIEQYVAGEGGSTYILARAIGVSNTTVRKWMDDDEQLKESYESAREAYMHKLYLELIQMSRLGKGNVAGIIFSLKAKFKQYDMPQQGKLVDVNVSQVTPVMVVRDHGTDEEWAAKAAAQQRQLLIDAQHEPLTVQQSLQNALPAPAETQPIPQASALSVEPSEPIPPASDAIHAPSWRPRA